MTQPLGGRPSHSLNPNASHAARLGAEIRARRQAQGLTLKALAALIGFSPQHLSEVERAKVPMSEPFVAACDRALEARGTLLALLPAVVCERALQRHDRGTERRRSATEAPADPKQQALPRALGSARYASNQAPSEAGEDVDPLSRRSLLGTGVGAAIGLGSPFAIAASPTSGNEIDPELVRHWLDLKALLDRHDAMCGPHDVLTAVRHEINLIAGHRKIATGGLGVQLMRVEARWSQFASWLSNDAGDGYRRDSWSEHALRLAQEADYDDMVAYVLMRRSQWALQELDAGRAISLAEAALGTRGMSDQMRALCTLKQAQGYALANDMASCERSLAAAYDFLDRTDGPESPWDDLASQEVTRPYVMAADARCWLWLEPRKAIGLYEDVLGLWTGNGTRGRGLHQARLALACVAAGEQERAAAEGIKALEVVRDTRSDMTLRELTRLDRELAGCDTAGGREFREGFAGI